jgi:hypothetical protein
MSYGCSVVSISPARNCVQPVSNKKFASILCRGRVGNPSHFTHAHLQVHRAHRFLQGKE